MSKHSTEQSTDQLLKLSEEVSRIASSLARMSGERVEREPVLNRMYVPALSPDAVESTISARKLRASYFAGDLFADPAWDMMLELLSAELGQRRVSVTALCQAAAVPPTTALRWLNTMVKNNLFVRETDHLDARRSFVALSPQTSNRLRGYFNEIACGPSDTGEQG